MLDINNIIRRNILHFLNASDPDVIKELLNSALQTKIKHTGNKIYLRGIIEYSNICKKNCLYCGIRASNQHVSRYYLDEAAVLKSAKFAHEKGFGSIVIQTGERTGSEFIETISTLLEKIKKLSNNELGITLSCGEQSIETYKKWFDNGAHRYLLRIESSTEDLYYKIHPQNDLHDFKKRLKALEDLKKVGYQTGSGVMIGLPFQTIENLADDLMFFKDMELDMVGMGPYIEHKDTPLYKFRQHIPPMEKRLDLSLKMVALLRLMMKDINIAASTSLDVLDPKGRFLALSSGANVFMPNLTPQEYFKEYFLYQNKPNYSDSMDIGLKDLEIGLKENGQKIGYKEWGDSMQWLRQHRG